MSGSLVQGRGHRNDLSKTRRSIFIQNNPSCLSAQRILRPEGSRPAYLGRDGGSVRLSLSLRKERRGAPTSVCALFPLAAAALAGFSAALSVS